MQQEILEFIIQDLCFDNEVIEADTALFSSRILDSMCLLELVQFLEEKAGVKVSPADLVFENFDTVASMILYLDKRSPSPGPRTSKRQEPEL